MQIKLADLIRGTSTTERACGPYEERWDDEMGDVLSQLWLHIAEPVLRYLKVSLS